MRISGGTTLGNCEIGSVVIDTNPTKTIRIAMTIATIGRLMKKRYMTAVPQGAGLSRFPPGRWRRAGLLVLRSWRELHRVNLGAIFDLLCAFGDDAIVGL